MLPILRRAVIAVLACAVLIVYCATASAADYQLRGEDVVQVVRTFLRHHYSRSKFDDAQSAKMLQLFLDQFDPQHTFFLQSDIDEIKQSAGSLDEQFPKGNTQLAFKVFERIKQRLAERERSVQILLKSKIKLSPGDTITLDRRNAPYPVSTASAAKILRRKIKLELIQRANSSESMDKIREDITKRYRNLRLRIGQYNRNDVIASYLNAFTKSFDPHSAYLSRDDLENFNIALRLSLEGIGATLRWEDGYTIISTIIPGGAAFREGTLQPEDKIVAVAQGSMPFEDVHNMRLGDVVKLIRGKRGTTVRLAYLRKSKGLAEKRHELAIVRDKIELKEGEATGQIKEIRRGSQAKPYRIGVIDLPSFYVDFAGRNTNPGNYKSSSRDVKNLLEGFIAQKVDGVILDLRDNGGGGLDEAVSLAGLFLNAREIVVMVKNERGRIIYRFNPHSAPLFRGPMAVLTNRYSASASEIVAGAFKDYGRAIIVGESSTFGKGTVQNVISLPRNLGALKTTVAKFYRPGSSSTQHRGVVSDIVLPSLNNYKDLGESSLANAMPWDAVRAASIRKWDDLSVVLPTLSGQSEIRRKSNSAFKDIALNVRNYLSSKKGQQAVRIRDVLADARKFAESNHKSNDSDTDGENVSAPDPHLDETMNILVDFIELKSGVSAKRMVAK